ncbi:MAG: hypothetical protein ACLTDP_00155 [Terrisporobacter sp.]
MKGAEIIAFLFIVGGAFSVISKTKAIDFGILRIVEIFKRERDISITNFNIHVFTWWSNFWNE